jgi:S1-C subfamily serine protease
MYRQKGKYFTARLVLVTSLLSLLVTVNPVAQVITKTFTVDNPDEFMMLNEFGGMIIGAGDTVKVEMVMPPDNRAEAYKMLDIQGGDIIKMANGKALSSVKSLKSLYDETDVGGIIKLGIIRGGKPLLVKFAKANPDENPQGMHMVFTQDIDDSAPTSLMGIGLILAVDGNEIKINDIMKEIIPEFTGYTPQKDDIITKINDTELKSPDELDKVYGKIEPGETVSLTFLHNGQSEYTTFNKPADQGMRRVIRKTN